MNKVDLITSQLASHLLEKIEQASTICILTSFVMKSGVQLLSESLKRAAERGADIKICTGDYLYITQPEALSLLYKINPRIEIRLWNSNGISFHPKAYLFQLEENNSFVIGSSNMSRSALTSGVEWNISIDNSPIVFNEALDEFTKLMYHDKTYVINEETIKVYQTRYNHYHKKNPNFAQIWTKLEELELMLPEIESSSIDGIEIMIKEDPLNYGEIAPRFAQIEALEELEKTVEEGYHTALVIMATGLGKTYLAGFFAKKYQRILFIAHREEILNQAKKSFAKIMKNRSFGVYNGKQKDGDADCVFASIYTLSMVEHLKAFKPKDFDLIIIDEFHHAAAKSYQRVLNYFETEFLLGITATPERSDNKDVYSICDGNIAYRMEFLEAIQKKWLAPFQYYGVYDETDYSKITWLGSRYDEEELVKAQLKKELASKILGAWKKYKKTKSIVFCSSIRQAVFLSAFFNQSGYKTISLHSKQKDYNRESVIKQLESEEIDAIFTVDLFNEGVDIPSVDTLLFVRPTESLTIFTQQIGRGLRLHESKEHCVIIDLIGNYRNADIKLSLFQTDKKEEKFTKSLIPTVPENCSIKLDLSVIDLLKEMAKKRQPRKEQLLNSYKELKQELGRRPTYLELHLQGKMDSIQYRQEFKSYIGFLDWAEELSEKEVEVYFKQQKWLEEVEKTGMTKSYKMVVLMSMLNRGLSAWHYPISPEEAAAFFYQYLTEKEYRKRIDFSDKETKKLWEYDEKKVSSLIAKMPMRKWSESSKGLISFDSNEFILEITTEKKEEQILYQWTKEICEYRLHYHFERKSKW